MARKANAPTLFPKSVPFDPATVELPTELRTPGFLRAWFAWCDYRARKRCKVSSDACSLQLSKLAKFGPDVAIAAIQTSIENDYQGLFPEKVGRMIAGRIAAPEFSGLRQWAEQNKAALHQEYGT